jgi:hypothetical protein
MSRIDFDQLIRTLAAFMAANASSALVYDATPRSVWAHSAVEKDATDTYSVVRNYGGSLPWVPVAGAAVQVKTVSRIGVTAAFVQSTNLFNTLFDAAGQPLRGLVLSAGIRLNAADCQQPPSFLSLDDRGRAEVVFNVNLKAVATA